MLVQFTVGNYRSIKEPITLSMVAANLVSQDKSLDENNTFTVGKLKLLKSAAIYGANASGKSNLIKALNFMIRFINDSTNIRERIEVDPFLLNTETENASSFFEMIFIIEGQRYRYGFEIDSEKIHSEWLFHTPKSREANLFLRNDQKIVVSSNFKEGKGITDKTRKDALFLSVTAQFNGLIASQISNYLLFRSKVFLSEGNLLDDRGLSLMLLNKKNL